jgi:hypothetical protein
MRRHMDDMDGGVGADTEIYGVPMKRHTDNYRRLFARGPNRTGDNRDHPHR